MTCDFCIALVALVQYLATGGASIRQKPSILLSNRKDMIMA